MRSLRQFALFFIQSAVQASRENPDREADLAGEGTGAANEFKGLRPQPLLSSGHSFLLALGGGQGAPEWCQNVPGLFMKHLLAMASAPLSLPGWWETTDIAMDGYL